MVRTALFNWAYARHTGGTFVFRIEDTDSARDSEESYEQLLDVLRWLGLDWDEGPEVGGEYGPYRQSQRMALYTEIAQRLVDEGFAYNCYCTAEELEAKREQAMAQKRPPGYDGTCRELTDAQRAAFEAEGRSHVVRMRMPDVDYTWDDLVRGEVTFKAEHVPDFVIVRANGEPLYTLVNPVDDALMHITHVLRGEDLLSSTPRQLVMHDALGKLGVGPGVLPQFGHLPYVMGEGNKKLSKRDPEASFQMYKEQGYLPEGLINYLALLGFSYGDDIEFFSKEQLAEVFDISRVNASPARFDLKKCTAINADWMRALKPEDLQHRVKAFLEHSGFTVKDDVLAKAIPLVQERMETLGQAAGMLGFLFIDEAAFAIDANDKAAVESEDGQRVLAAAHQALSELETWDTASIDACLRAALIEELGLKPKVAFGAVRVATTGRRVSPPLFESLELLGRERSLNRIAAVSRS